MQPLSGNQRPDLLTSLMNMSLVPRLPRKMHLCRSSSNVQGLPSFLEMLQNPHVLLIFEKVHNPLRLPCETTSERPKVVRTRQIFTLLTSRCASRHNGMHFFDISTSKSGLNVVCFAHFDLETCFAPQRVTFSTSQLQKVLQTWCVLHILTWKCASRHNGVHFFDIWTSQSSEHGVFCTVWHGNVLRAITACTFSTSQLPKVLRTWCVLHSLTSKCASRALFRVPKLRCVVHFDLEMCFALNGVQLLISHLTTWLRTRRFSEPTFRPSGATNHWKTPSFATFLPFHGPGSSFFWDFLFFDLLSSSLLFADSSHLCFSFVHCRKFDS